MERTNFDDHLDELWQKPGLRAEYHKLVQEEREVLVEFLQEVAKGPYPDSDPISLLHTLTQRARAIIKERGLTPRNEGEQE